MRIHLPARIILLSCLFYFSSLPVLCAQSNANWKYIRPSTTGLGGDYIQCIKVDRCGNKWTGGYLPFWSEGAVTRFDDSTFTCWSNVDGYLPADRVYDLAFDNNDGLWVATNGVGNGIAHGGISHYNGTTWTTYTSANSPLPGDDMRGIVVDHHNNVWATFLDVSTGIGGVAKFDGSNWNIFLPATSGLPTAYVDKITVDAQDNIWIGTNAGLVKFDGSNWTTYNNSNSGLTSNNVTDVETDEGTNKIYAATGAAIDIFDGTNWGHINASNAPVSSSGLWAVDAKNGKIIIVTLGGTYLTYIYNGTGWISHPENDQTYDARIDDQGNYWTAGIGVLSKYNGTAWTIYNSKNTGLTGMFNDDIFIDSKNRAWLASNDNGGINMFDCPRWKDFNPYNAGLWPSPVSYTGSGSGITEDSFGDLWMLYNGTLGAVVQVPHGNVNDPASWIVWNNANSGISLQSVKRAAADKSGNVWIGYEGACSVSKYSHATHSWTNYNLYQLGQVTCGAGSGIKSIRVDKDNKVWICGAGGLASFDQNNWTFYSYLNSPLQGLVMDIAFDNNGNKWVATEHGLLKFDGINWTTYTSANSGLLFDFCTSVVVDTMNTVWVGNYDPSLTAFNPGGLCSFNGNTWTQYRPDNSGIQEKIIDRLAFDTLQNLWIMGATHGLAIFNPNAVQGYQCLDKALTCFSPLPVSMEYFKGHNEQGKNFLTWQAACSSTEVSFDIERSDDNRTYSVINSIPATNIRCLSPFSFTDDVPYIGINYYRIKMTTGEGNISYSQVIALLNRTRGFEIISLSPNPVKNGTALLSITAAQQQTFNIVIHDMLGNSLYKKVYVIPAGYSQLKMDVSQLEQGVYTLTIISNQEDKKSIRFIKQ